VSLQSQTPCQGRHTASALPSKTSLFCTSRVLGGWSVPSTQARGDFCITCWWKKVHQTGPLTCLSANGVGGWYMTIYDCKHSSRSLSLSSLFIRHYICTSIVPEDWIQFCKASLGCTVILTIFWWWDLMTILTFSTCKRSRNAYNIMVSASSRVSVTCSRNLGNSSDTASTPMDFTPHRPRLKPFNWLQGQQIRLNSGLSWG